MAPTAAYDEIADWYEQEFLASTTTPGTDPLGIQAALGRLLGRGSGICLEIGCGTGVWASRVRELGWTPWGMDISAAMLRYARGRLLAVRADAARLPVRDGCLPAVLAVMVHTDMPGYPAVLAEAARVLRPGGTFVHIGVHPCFCGGFADRSDPAAVRIRPGYLDSHWTRASWSTQGVRDKVGASHWPLPSLMNAFVDACLPRAARRRRPARPHHAGHPGPQTGRAQAERAGMSLRQSPGSSAARAARSAAPGRPGFAGSTGQPIRRSCVLVTWTMNCPVRLARRRPPGAGPATLSRGGRQRQPASGTMSR